MKAVALSLLFALLAVPAVSTDARGDNTSPSDVEQAKTLFFEGIAREDAGDWKGALEKFHQALSIRATPAIRFHVALCLEKTGRLVSARAEFERVRDQGIVDGPMSVVTKARQHLEALDARIPAIDLRVSPALAMVTVDGHTVDPKTAIRLDPGPHDVVAEAAGYSRFERRVNLEDFSPAPVVVMVTLAPFSPVIPSRERPTPSAATTTTGRSPLPLVIGGVGALALVSSGVMFVFRAGAIRDLDGKCGSARDACPESARPLEDRAHLYNTAGNVLLITGGVLLSAGIILHFASTRSAATVTPTNGGAHVTWSVTF